MAVEQFTYTFDPQNEPRDAVRFLIGDTDECDPLIDDREIAYAIQQKGPGLGAAYFCAQALAAKFTRQVTASAGQISESASERARQFRELADSLSQQLASRARPVFGGTSVAKIQAQNEDLSRPQPSSKRDQFDNPEASNDNTSPTRGIL